MAVSDVAHIKHRIDGRIRFKFSDNYNKELDLNRFLEIGGVLEVTFDKMTKSLVILYEENIINFRRLLDKISIKFPKLKIIDDNKYQENGYSNLLSQLIVGNTTKVNKKVYSASKGAVDLGSLAPAGLFLAGIGRLLSKPVMPNWYDLVWWSYNSFLHFNPPNMESVVTNAKKKK